jgi:hypothetical protein
LTASSEALHRRLQAIRSRAAIRRWEARRRDHAAGAWFRVPRLLAYSRTAWAISDADAEGLIAAGHSPDPAGLELEPQRRYFVVDETTLKALTSAREVALQASPELLACRTLALVPFDLSLEAGPDLVHRRPSDDG